MNVFIDASAFIALRAIDDSCHNLAKRIIGEIAKYDYRLITSNFIMAESITMISQKVSHQDAIEFREQDLTEVEVVRISEELEDKAFEIFKKLTSKNVSFVDCTSFALMRELGIRTVFSFDQHFKQQGFKLLE